MKTNLKKLMSLIMILVLACSLVACGGDSSDKATATPAATEDTGDAGSEDDASDDGADEAAEPTDEAE